MINIRTKFRRGDEVKFISHLDLMKVFERAIRRARLPISYSQGFNPHPGMVFGLPLSVGVTSDAEYGEFEITDDNMPVSEFVERLNAQLPNGLEILAAKPRKSKQNIMATIAASEYIVVVGTKSECSGKTLKANIQKYLSQEEIIVAKKTKSGVKDTDIKDMIFDMDFELQPCGNFNTELSRPKSPASIGDGCPRTAKSSMDSTNFQRGANPLLKEGSFNIIRLTMLVSAGSKANLKPDLLVDSLFGFMNFDFEIDRIHRTKLFVKSEDKLLDPMDILVL